MNPATTLDREWPQLVAGPLPLALASWRQSEPALRRFVSPAQLCPYFASEPGPDANAPLFALLSLTRSDPLAGRTVLQTILPALKLRAERLLFEPWEYDEVW